MGERSYVPAAFWRDSRGSSGLTSLSIVVHSAASPLKLNRTSTLSGPMVARVQFL